MELSKDMIRLNSVKRIDPYVTSIVDSALRTALYNYDVQADGWSKTEVEGTFMVYNRKAPPVSMITIINRLNKENFLEPLTPQCEIQVKPPYLLFRSSTGVIFGIWFSVSEDVHRVSEAIMEKIKPETAAQPPASDIMKDPAIAAARTSGGDIMTMLSKAHGEYAHKKNEPTDVVNNHIDNNNEVHRPGNHHINDENSTSNVADFFAKIGGGMAGNMSAASPNASRTMPNNAHSPNVKSTTNPVLQQLFRGAAAMGGQATVAATAGNSQTTTAPVLIPRGQVMSQNDISPSANTSGSAPMSLQELEGRLKENLQISNQPKEENSQIIFNYQNGQLNLPYNHLSSKSDQSLLSPQVFTSPHVTDRNPSGGESPCSRNFPGLFTPSTGILDMKPLGNSEESLNGNLAENTHPNLVTPLTREQLVQAFNILLKKDDFIHQLHDAYIQALNQSLKGCL